jgi:membrane-associated phospholipid phosphatase
MARGSCLFDVSLPLDNSNVWEDLSYFYGYVPFVYWIGLFLVFLVYKPFRGTREFSWIVFGSVPIVVSEIMKSQFPNTGIYKRPDASCSVKKGMPSGHSSLCVGWIVLILCDLCCNSSSASNKYKIINLSLLIFLIFPAPISRIVLQDHTGYQVMAGSMLGIGLAILWWISVSVVLANKYKHFYNKYIFNGWVIHNLSPVKHITGDNESHEVAPIMNKNELEV